MAKRRTSEQPQAAAMDFTATEELTGKQWSEPSVYLLMEMEAMENLSVMDFMYKAAPKRGKVWWQGEPRELAGVLLNDALEAYRKGLAEPAATEPYVKDIEERERELVECARLLLTEWEKLDWQGDPAEDLIARRNKGLGLLLGELPLRYPVTAAMVRRALEAVK